MGGAPVSGTELLDWATELISALWPSKTPAPESEKKS
jgi:hypothetical protein